MAKKSGLSWTTLSVDDSGNTQRDVRNDITNFQFATPRAVQDVTGIDKAANERILLLADFSITLNGVFNDQATTGAHIVFRTVSSTSVNRLVTMVITGNTLAPTVLFTDYSLTRAAAGELTWTTPGALANGVVPLWT
jgi:hypothetical protein